MSSHLSLAPSPSAGDVAAEVVSPVRLVLADDHALMRRSLRSVLEREEGIEVIAEAGDLASVARHVDAHRPDVLALDTSMPDGSAMEAIGRLRECVPNTKIVMLTTDDSVARARRALAAGALGYVLKEHADSELPEAIAAAARGEQYVSPRLDVRVGGTGQSASARAAGRQRPLV
jgi:two-component system response regulator NreC